MFLGSSTTRGKLVKASDMMNFNTDEVWNNLTTHRVQIAHELRVDRSLLFDYLRSKAIFDSEDCQLVHAEKTNERKAGKLLDILQTKAKDSLVHFVDVLQLLNPGLYEKLTGEKATARLNPIINEVGDKGLSDIDPARDLDLLSNHLKRAVTDLQEMILRYEQVLKENQQLSKSLSKATSDLDLSNKRLQSLENEARKVEEQGREAQSNAGKIEQAAALQMQDCQQVLSERNAYIMVLLLKLLTAEDEAKNLRKQVEENTQKNQEMLIRFKELSQNFDNQRRESIKLSKRLADQRRSVQEIEHLNNTYLELQLKSQDVQMEKDRAVAELVELKSWTEALMARYDIVEKTKRQCQESYEHAVAGCSLFQKQLEDLEFQLSISRRQEASLKKQNEELGRALNHFRGQRDFYDEARKEAIKERDEARSERDETIQQYKDAQEGRDRALIRHAQDCRELENRREAAVAELQALREQLARVEEELRRSKMEGGISADIKSPLTVRKDMQTCTPGKSVEDGPIKQPHCTHVTNDDHVLNALELKPLKSCADVIKSVRRRFGITSENSCACDNEARNEDTMLPFVRSLSQLPFQALTDIYCSAISPSTGESSRDPFALGSFVRFKSDDSAVCSSPSDVVDGIQATTSASHLQRAQHVRIVHEMREEKITALPRNENIEETEITSPGCLEMKNRQSDVAPNGLSDVNESDVMGDALQYTHNGDDRLAPQPRPRLTRLDPLRRPLRGGYISDTPL